MLLWDGGLCLHGPPEFGTFTYGSGKRRSALGQISLQARTAMALARGGLLILAFLLLIPPGVTSFSRCRAQTSEKKLNPKLFCQSGSRQLLDLRAEVFGRLSDLCSEVRGDCKRWTQGLGLLLRGDWVPRCSQSTLGILKKNSFVFQVSS